MVADQDGAAARDTQQVEYDREICPVRGDNESVGEFIGKGCKRSRWGYSSAILAYFGGLSIGFGR